MRINEIYALGDDYKKAKKRGMKFDIPASSKAENQAIKWYRGYGYLYINAKLRGHEPKYKFDPDEIEQDHGFKITPEEAIKALDDFIEKFSHKRKLTVYRGEADYIQAKKLLSHEIGYSYTDAAYVSTSLSASYALYAFSSIANIGVISMILLPPKVKAAYVSYNDEHSETEVLIARNTTFTLREKRIIPNKNRRLQ